MGQNCCVAARDKSSLPNRISHEASTFRNVRQSPIWNFRWDNRTHIEDIMEKNAHYSHNNSGNVTSEVKSVFNVETDGLSDRGSPHKGFQTSQWRKSIRGGGSDNTKFIGIDQSTACNSSPETNELESSVLPNGSDKSSIAIPYLSPPSVKVEDPSSSSTTGFTPADPTSRKSIRSHGFQLNRQISDSGIPSLKFLDEDTSSLEAGRLSFVLGNELSAIESHGLSSDGWSMRTFLELIASSQRERSSLDGESLKIFGSNLQPRGNHTPNLHTCGICSKLVKENSPWSTHKIVSTNDLPVAAVLVCGHAFHAECLESSTLETEMYDPPCHVCSNNVEKLVLKQPGTNEPKGRNRRSRIAVGDGGVDSISDLRMRSGKGPFMGASASMKSSFSKQFIGKGPFLGASSSMKDSFSKPFLMRHLSTGSRPKHSSSEDEKSRKKWFWPRYLRE